MSQLRNTLLELQKEKTLKLLLGNDYDTASEDQKQHYLSVVGDQIERDVDLMLHEYVINFQSNTPVSRKGKKLKWVYIVGNVSLGILLAYAVNKEQWVFAIGIGVLTVINQYLPFVYEKE